MKGDTMKVAIQTNVWSPERHQNLDDMFNEIAGAGYDGFESGAHRIDLTQPDQFRALAAKHKLQIAGLHIHNWFRSVSMWDG
jgi:sugar phosphate isomerase/epimerase